MLTKSITALALATWVLSGSVSVFGSDKPNVLFIAIDDQNDWIGYIGGHPQAQTPHIDVLAKRGTAFTNAHCQSPLCNPSRTSVLIGRRPSSTGIYGLAPWFRSVPELRAIETLPQYFMRHGYSAYGAGKLFHGRYGTSTEKKKGEVKEWDHFGPGATGKPFPPEKLVKTPAPHKLVDWGTFPHKDEEKGDWIIADWVVDQLANMPDDKPFFMGCGFFLPHVPCYVTQKWLDLYPKNTTQLPEILVNDRDDTPRYSWYLHWQLPEPRLKFLQEENEWSNLVRAYLASTSFVDSQVGRVMAALESSGHADNTVVVLWSDHGWHIGEKAITGKNTLWDDGTRVPLIFAGPGVKADQSCSQPAELLDIYPTLLDLCDLPSKPDLEGISLRPQLENFKMKRARPAITTHNRNNHGVRSRNWRYITYADGSEELYDMRNDPNEWHNLIGDEKYVDVIEWHRSKLPKVNRKPVPGSRSRILTNDGQTIEWEGKEIKPDDPIPELEE
ncbi:MAG: sulfatase [Verrucomicrobiota bacterium]